MKKTMEEVTRNRKNEAGLTLAEILISLVILAIGLSGILSLFPVGQKLAAECEQNSIATIIAHNYASIIRCYVPDNPPDDVATFANATGSGPKGPLWSGFSSPSSTFETKINSFAGSYLFDDTAGVSNYNVSLARRSPNRGNSVYSLTLIVIHKEGSEKLYSFLVGHGFDDFEREP